MNGEKNLATPYIVPVLVLTVLWGYYLLQTLNPPNCFLHPQKDCVVFKGPGGVRGDFLRGKDPGLWDSEFRGRERV